MLLRSLFIDCRALVRANATHQERLNKLTMIILLTFFCLDTKESNKEKIKDNPKAPPVCPGQRHTLRSDG